MSPVRNVGRILGACKFDLATAVRSLDDASVTLGTQLSVIFVGSQRVRRESDRCGEIALSALDMILDTKQRTLLSYVSAKLCFTGATSLLEVRNMYKVILLYTQKKQSMRFVENKPSPAFRYSDGK